MKKILTLAAVAAAMSFAACTGNKTASTSEPDSLCCQASCCAEKCECPECACPEGACAEGNCGECSCKKECGDKKECSDKTAGCPADEANNVVASLKELIEKGDAEGIKAVAAQFSEKIAAFIARGDQQAAERYAAVINNFVAENFDKLQSLGVATAFSDAIANVEGLPASISEIATSAAKGIKSDILTNIINAVTSAKDAAAGAATDAAANVQDAANEAVDAAAAKVDEAKDAAKEAAGEAVDAAAAAAKQKLGL